MYTTIYLKVPFSEKEQAKQFGCRWNPEMKQWYITLPNGADLSNVLQWMSDDAPLKPIKTAKPAVSDKPYTQYLSRKTGERPRFHYWNGEDTACRMWSTGGIKRKGKFIALPKIDDDARLCRLCKAIVESKKPH